MNSLYYNILGEGEPIVLLHGLLGMSDNLGSLAKTLAEDYKVISIDAINHGESPHQAVVSYDSMADDVLQVMDKLGIEKAAILGHSMGGKTAMQIAVNAADRVSRLIVADIAPVDYPTSYHTDLFAAMKAVSEETINSRKDADSILEKNGVSTLGVRQFLLKNFASRDEAFIWAYDKKEKYSEQNRIKERAVKKVASEKFFYDMHTNDPENSYEYVLEKIENDTARIIAEIIKTKKHRMRPWIKHNEIPLGEVIHAMEVQK